MSKRRKVGEDVSKEKVKITKKTERKRSMQNVNSKWGEKGKKKQNGFKSVLMFTGRRRAGANE